MNFKKSMFVTILAFGIASACGEKKPKEVNADDTAVEKAREEISKEAAEKEAKIKAAKQRVEDSLRKVDSLQQVKEHGHVH